MSLETPIKKGKSSIKISGRRLLFDIYSKNIGTESQPKFGYFFYDINIDYVQVLSPKNKIKLTIFRNNDNLSFNKKKSKENLEYKSVWVNNLSIFKWENTQSQSKTEQSFAFTNYNYNNKIKNETTKLDYQRVFASSISDLIYIIVHKRDLNKRYKLLLGNSFTFHAFLPFKITGDKQIKGKEYFAGNNSIFVENEIILSDKTTINIGLRQTSFLTLKKNYYLFSPRLFAKHEFSKFNIVSFSFSVMHQPIHNVEYAGAGLPTNLWFASNEKITPQKMRQYSMSWQKKISKSVSYNFGTYYKKSENLILMPISFLPTNDNFADNNLLITNGTGTAYGVENMLIVDYEKVSGWLSYTLSKTLRNFPNYNNNEPFGFKYDRTHSFSSVVNIELTTKITLSATWTWLSGFLISLPNQYYQLPSNIVNTNTTTQVQISTSKNTFRTKPFHKLDIGVNYSKKIKKYTHTANFSVYNFYNRQNAYYYFFKETDILNEIGDNTGQSQTKLFQQSLFPIIPSISYSFKF